MLRIPWWLAAYLVPALVLFGCVLIVPGQNGPVGRLRNLAVSVCMAAFWPFTLLAVLVTAAVQDDIDRMDRNVGRRWR